MALLIKRVTKKVKASSLPEVLISVSIILIVFVIATTTIDNLLVTKTKSNQQKIWNRYAQLQYQYKHRSLSLPFEQQYGRWQILIYRNKKDKSVIFEANTIEDNSNRIIKKTLCFED